LDDSQNRVYFRQRRLKMGAMKNLKLAQMELMEKYAAKIVTACSKKTKRAERVASLLHKCGFDHDSPSEAVSMVKANMKEIRCVFGLINTAHKAGMRTKWRGPYFDQLTSHVGRAESLLETYLGFSTNMNTLAEEEKV
jgi:hypothetical protein